MLVFPPDLQSEVMEGIEFEPGDDLIESQMDAGTVKRRPRSLDINEIVRQTIEIKTTDLTTLMTFWRVTTKKGALPFSFPGLMPDGSEATIVYFARKPKYQNFIGADAAADRWWRVQLEFEIRGT